MNSNNPIAILDGMIESLKSDDNYIDDGHEMLSPGQVAGELKLHIGTVYKLIGDGQLKAYNLSSGNRKTYYRIRRVDLENYLEERYCVR